MQTFAYATVRGDKNKCQRVLKQITANGHKKPYPLFKMLLIMKFLGIFIFAACLQVNAGVTAQTVTLKANNTPLEKVLKEVKKQTGYYYFSNSRFIYAAKPVTIEANKLALEEFLKLCFKDQPFTYELNEKTIVLKEKPAIPVVGNTAPNENAAIAANIDVTITVLNTDNQPLEGASIIIKGSNKGIASDINGRATLRGVDANAIIIISFTGYASQEYKLASNPGLKSGVSNPTPIVIRLVASANELNEVIILNKGYYTEEQRYTVGNSQRITSKDIEKQPVQNPLLTLQGRIPGIEITQLTGLPGGGVKVQIQGNTSIGSLNGLTTTNPLIVIDGVPYPNELANSIALESFIRGGSPLSFINPSDIESIDVLKDADATAIFGSRAANGAILITTKKGKPGRTKLTLNLQQGWGEVGNEVQMLNTQQYLTMRREAFNNDRLMPSAQPNATSPFVYAPDLMFWDTTRYTNWQKELIGGTAQYNHAELGVSGGSESVQYMVSGTFNRQTTVFPGDYDDKMGALHLNINSNSANQKLRIQLTSNYSYDDNHLPGADLTTRAILMAPNAPPLFNANGSLNWAQNSAGTSTFYNPLAYLLNADFKYTTHNLVSNLNVNYKIMTGLELRSSVGYTNMQSNMYIPLRLESNPPELRANAQRIALFGKRNMNSWIIEPQAEYRVKLLRGDLTALVGSTIQKSSVDFLSVNGSGFSTDLLMKTLNAATSISVGSSYASTTRFNALFGLLNYRWNKKYLLNLTSRRDGSNKFGDKNKFHNFWSVGGGWIFSEEKIVNRIFPFLSFGKVRASYGTTGNDGVPEFAYLGLYNISTPTIQYQNSIGLDIVRIPNPHLQWEETRKLQTGLDLEFMKERLILSVTYTKNRSSNQLIPYILPSYTGSTSYYKNRPAIVQNTSWEVILNTAILKSRNNLSWRSSINLTIPRNKLLSFPGIEKTAYATGFNGVIVGQPLGVQKVYPFGGPSPVNGLYYVNDLNNNPVYSPTNSDRNVIVTPLTKYYGGLVNTISYKGFQLDFLLQFTRRIGVRDMVFYNGSWYPGQYIQGQSNQPVAVLDRWQKAGDNTPFGRFSTNGLISSVTNSNIWYSSDASYVRLKNVSLSWQLPERWVKSAKLQNAWLYTNAQNLLTFTKYAGIDPESGALGLPPLRMITIGGKFGF